MWTLLFTLWLALPGTFSAPALGVHAAQTTPEAPAEDGSTWSTPINLSQSGVAFDPAMVVDASGTAHVLWQEAGIASLLHSQLTDTGWSDVSPVEFPFGTRTYYPALGADEAVPLFTPQLVSTADGEIHAFWRDEEQALYHSRVDTGGFQELAAWSQRRLVASGAVQVDVTVGAEGTLHVAYVGAVATGDLAAGIYYTYSTDGGSSWSEPVLLYPSRYFRNLSNNNANVRVAAGAANSVYVAWDSPPREKVFLARSSDEGESWSEPLVVDERQPDDPKEGEGPREILLEAMGDTVHAVWRASHETATCNVYHQRSIDGGESWEAPAEPVLQLATCPEQSKLLAVGDSLFLLLRVEAQSYLLVSDGERWSEPEVQEPLSGFTSQETYRPVEFLWHDAAVLDGNRLFVLGRDGGDRADIWVMSRPLGVVEEWFPPPSPWTEATTVAVSQTTGDGLSLVTDATGLVHTFWSQPRLTEEGEESENEAVYYARWTQGRWSQPFPMLTPVSGEVHQLAVALSPAGRLYVFWTEPGGNVYFSQANSSEAQTPTEWAEPRMVAEVHDEARSLSIAFNEEAQLFVAYAVPLNEARGIHLTHSEDGGVTWSDPVTVFDAVGAGWSMVDRPYLEAASDGRLHLIWTRFSLPPEARPLSLHYTYSTDGGENWSESQLVMEGNVTWGALSGLEGGILQRVWRMQHEEGTRFWYDMSLNGGQTWTRAERLAVFDVGGSVALASDGRSQLHLVHLSQSGLGHQWWNGEFWEDAGRVTLDGDGERYEVKAAIKSQGDNRLFVAYVGEFAEVLEEEGEFGIFALDRAVESQAAMPAPLPTLTSTPMSVPEATPTPDPTPDPTPTVAFPAGEQGSQRTNIPGTGSIAGGLAVGLLPVGLLVLVVILYSLRTSWFGRKR